jgi:hypothetical protein
MFKVGDKVRCVDDRSCHGRIQRGKVYTVTAVSAYQEHVSVDGTFADWHTDRFVPSGAFAIKPSGTHVLATDAEERKNTPIFSGVMNYFPLALAAVARRSSRGNDKHNPGEPLYWAREKSQDHADCVARHLIDHKTIDPETGEYEEATAMAWRALALLQELEEKRLGKPPSRGSK